MPNLRFNGGDVAFPQLILKMENDIDVCSFEVCFLT